MRNALALLILLAGSGPSQPRAAVSGDQQSLEYQVKAAFLLNFTKFIEWPKSETSNADLPFNICILGTDPFGPVLDQMVQGEIVGDRKLTVQRIGRESARSCQILYVGKSEKRPRELVGKPVAGVLTVGEGEGFTGDGGVIAFVVENRRVRFSINLVAARNAALKVSSKLLSVAKSVEN